MVQTLINSVCLVTILLKITDLEDVAEGLVFSSKVIVIFVAVMI